MQKLRTERLSCRIVCLVIKAELNKAIVLATENENYCYDNGYLNVNMSRLSVDLTDMISKSRFEKDIVLKLDWDGSEELLNISISYKNETRIFNVSRKDMVLLRNGGKFSSGDTYIAGDNGFLTFAGTNAS